MKNDTDNQADRVWVYSPDTAWSHRFRELLGGSHWDVRSGTREADLWRSLDARAVDLMVLNLCEGDLAGPGILERVRSLSDEQGIPMVAVVPEGADVQAYLDAGATDVLENSAVADELVPRLGAILRFKRWFDERHLDRADLAAVLLLSQQRIEDLEIDNERLRELSLTDALTGLCNLRSFERMLDQEFLIAKRYGHPVSLLMLDLDHFTKVNNTYGHPSGDFVLRELAGILHESVRESDIVARLGGEEFAVLLPRADREQAIHLAERIRLTVATETFRTFGNDIQLTVSIGSASWPRCPEICDPDMLLYFADQALLGAKNAGRDRTVAVSDMDFDMRRAMWKSYRRQCNTQAPPDAWPDQHERIHADGISAITGSLPHSRPDVD